MNDAVADRFEEFADRLEARGVEYKPQAYRTAAENVRTHPEDVAALAAEGPGAVQAIEGVGEALAEKVLEYAETGRIEELEAERERIPVDMPALTAVEGVGPKTVGRLYEALGVEDLDDLEAAAREGRIRDVEGYGEKSERNILDAVTFAREARQRTRLGDARPLAAAALETLEGVVERSATAGSLRRWRETVGDIDLLAAADDPTAAVDAVTGWDRVDVVIEAGETRASVRVGDEQLDLRVVAPEEFGATLQYFTGSREHNIRLRNRAIERDLRVNEYGVFEAAEGDDADGERLAGADEAGVYETLGLPWIPPELREDRGEIPAAADGELPDLVTTGEIRGDLHVHTDWSDGDLPIEETVAAAAAFGHEYVAITDHADGPGTPTDIGLSPGELREQRDAIRDLEADIEVFAGVEANVDAGGDIGLAEDMLAAFDVVVVSPHSGLDGDGTDRLVAAATHPQVDIVGHPTGRRINERPGHEVDYDRLGVAAADAGTALEVNANPARLDLGGGPVGTAIEAGATVAVNTDAHRPVDFDYLEYGVRTARRGWAETGDVLNARDADGLRAFFETDLEP